MTEPVVIDFETKGIERRPNYPPKPVGLAIDLPGLAPFYLAWGHAAGGNNCTEADAVAWLWRIWNSGAPVLCHNAKFDLAVALETLGLPMLPPERIHDTQFLAYLYNPHARSLRLKDLADDLLNIAPTERDAVQEWVWNNRQVIERNLGDRPKSRTDHGRFIWVAPGDVVGPYAIGDVTRTRALYNHLLPIILRHGMGPAYWRERQLVPIFMANEREGMRVNLPRLQADVEAYGKVFVQVEDWLRRRLLADGLNFDADQDVAQALIRMGIVQADLFPRTEPTKKHPAGQLSMSKENLMPELFTGAGGQEIASLLGYRNRLKTCLDTFMRPWLAQAEVNNGHITTSWNQTRGADQGGTRTGRPSTEGHNFLNISKSFLGRDDGYVPPQQFGIDAPDLPLCRVYVLPDEGGVMIHRDFSGQELRVFADFERGDLFSQYQRDPSTDPHKFVGAQLMAVAQREIERTRVKTLNFQGLYGGGIPALQRKLRCTPQEAKELKAFHDNALPGRKVLVEEIKRLVRRGEPIRTWGGRLYFCEPPGDDGRSKDYKLINYLVQGSAADLTKQALIDWHTHPLRTARFMVTVYDEINGSAPVGQEVQQMDVLREVMQARRMDTPMLSDGKMGPSWGELVKCA